MNILISPLSSSVMCFVVEPNCCVLKHYLERFRKMFLAKHMRLFFFFKKKKEN